MSQKVTHLFHGNHYGVKQAFITPIEREDILNLQWSMDDVLRGWLDHSAGLFEMYSITEAENTD